MAQALRRAAEVPLETARRAVAGLGAVAEAKQRAVGTVASDLDCAAHLLRAAGRCALENVRINIQSMKDETLAASLDAECAEVLKALD